jgi:hypothetical protein
MMLTTMKAQAASATWGHSPKAGDTGSNRLANMTRDPDLLAVTLIALVGLFIATCLIHFVPIPAEVATFLTQVS